MLRKIEAEKTEILSRERSGIGSWIADFLFVIFGLYEYLFVKTESTVSHASSQEISILFILILTIIPWYSGYLLHHFDGYPRFLKKLIQWVFGLITMSMLIFFALTLVPIIDTVGDPEPLDVFIGSFGMFFLVLGPMMIFGGYADAKFIDIIPSGLTAIKWPITTLVMSIIIVSVFLMILIIGQFDPTWEGNASFGVVMLGYLGGPVLAMLLAVPFIYIGKWIDRVDKARISLRLFAFLIPFLVFNLLIWWNDIVLFELKDWFHDENTLTSNVIWSMVIAGIIPFRLLILIKPPFKWSRLISGSIALTIYIMGVLSQF